MSTAKSTIQSYNLYARKWAEKMRSGKNTAHTYIEKPAMYGLLPNLKNKSVLCIGCGTGEECVELKSRGVKQIVGIDISKNLIDIAQQSYSDLEFKVMDMEKLRFAASSFDFVYSSLTLHYVKSWTNVLRNTYKVLKPKGEFLFSTHHPVKWGAETKKTKTTTSSLMGYEKFSSGKTRVFGDYFRIRKINDVWFDEFKVTYYHKPLSVILSEIKRSGFQITDFVEPQPISATAKVKSHYYGVYTKIPIFMIFKLVKK